MRRHKQRRDALTAALTDGAPRPGYQDTRLWGDAFSPRFETFLERRSLVEAASRVAGSRRALGGHLRARPPAGPDKARDLVGRRA